MPKGPKDWHPGGKTTGADARAEKLEAAVRRAFVDVYGAPENPETVALSIRSSYLPDGKNLGWTAPNEGTVLVMTERGWVQDPWSQDAREWSKVVGLLRSRGWPNAWWDSINAAVHVVYTED